MGRAKTPVYELTPEHTAQLVPWHEQWLKLATNCNSMTKNDREITRAAVRGLYQAANLTPPPDERIVFVPSPLVAVLAGGFAASLWHLRANPDFARSLSRNSATWAATRAATEAATGAATEAATWDATLAATEAATRDATGAATWAATLDATEAATWDATEVATWAATRAATEAATRAARSRLSPLARWLLDCVGGVHDRMYTDGGEWIGYVEFLAFFRDVAKIDKSHGVDFSKFEPYEKAALHGGVRVMHKEFCLVSDRPELLRTESNGKNRLGDDVLRLHSLTGPAKRYRDGWSIYAIHGVRVPAQVVEAPHTLTVEQIRGEQNAEIRRIMIDRFGAARYLRAIGAQIIHEDTDRYGRSRRLLSADVGDVEPLVLVEVVNATPEPVGYEPDEGAAGVWRGNRWFKCYTLRVDPRLRPMYPLGDPRGRFGSPQEMTCQNAIASCAGLRGEEYAPLVET